MTIQTLALRVERLEKAVKPYPQIINSAEIKQRLLDRLQAQDDGHDYLSEEEYARQVEALRPLKAWLASSVKRIEQEYNVRFV